MELEEIQLGEGLGAFRSTHADELPVRVASMRVMPKQGADLTQVKVKPRVSPPEKSTGLWRTYSVTESSGGLCKCNDRVPRGTG